VTLVPARWRTPAVLLILMSVAMPISMSTWMVVINNFAVEQVSFTGSEIGILQSVREIPGFLSFCVVFLLLIIGEQALALIALALLGLGTALTGYFPTFTGLLITTTLMSVGFHYFETVRQSLSLQWFSKERAPEMLGRLISVGALAALATYGFVFLAVEVGDFSMEAIYALGGAATVLLAMVAWIAFPKFPEKTEQTKKLILRRRYWLYYALTFMAGARRQIFIVFAAFLMVEKFGFSVSEIALLHLVNHGVSMVAAPTIGRLVHRWGERKMLSLEYIGLIAVFSAYAFVDVAWIAAGLYILDHFFFAMAIAIKTYFQKIADPGDIASTSGVSFTINHIAAVFIPVLFGLLWIISPSIVFLAGAALAAGSLVLARLIPDKPDPHMISVFVRPRTAPAE
jgi:predicted MFS family arabinose efflux permease